VIWFERREGGGWSLWLVEGEMPGLLDLPARVRKLLESRDFSDTLIDRLFPQAYRDDPEAESEYRQLLREDLVARKLEAVGVVEKCLAGRKRYRPPRGPDVCELRLSDEELSFWLGFLHDSRLTIGTALDITDEGWENNLDPEDPDFEQMLLLNQLSYLEESMIEAIREAEGIE
jgi:hypothetical protein